MRLTFLSRLKSKSFFTSRGCGDNEGEHPSGHITIVESLFIMPWVVVFVLDELLELCEPVDRILI